MTAPERLRLSWSMLRTQEECRQKAALMREGKRNPAKNLRNFYHGMVVDAVMVRWLRDPVPGAMPGMVDAQIQAGIDKARDDGDGVVRWRHADDRTQVRDYCVELVTRLEPLLDKHVLPWPHESALRFTETVKIPYLDGTPTEVDLVGEMDLLVHHDDGPVVLDLKGTADNQYWRRVIGQLVFYDLAVIARLRRRTHQVGLIQPMCELRTVGLSVTEDMRRDLYGRLTRMAQQIWSADRRCKDGTAGCTWCEVRHACTRYAPAATTDAFGSLADALREEARKTSA